MSLVGPRPWALYDAIRISPNGQQRLNALPGITGFWQLQARSTLLELDAVNNYDLELLPTRIPHPNLCCRVGLGAGKVFAASRLRLVLALDIGFENI